MSLNVRLYEVVQAANWLITNRRLYKDKGIVFDNDWVSRYSCEINYENHDNCTEQSELSDKSSGNASQTCDNEQEWNEGEAEIPAGVTRTMLTATDFLEDNERQYIFNVAPAERNKPSSVFRDKCSEELAYPGIFLSQARPENKETPVNVNYSDICKSEPRRSYRKAAMCIENIFYKTKKLQMKILLGKSHIAVRGITEVLVQDN